MLITCPSSHTHTSPAAPFTRKCRPPNILLRSLLSIHAHLTLAAVQSGSSTYHHGTQDVNNHWFLGRFYQMEITTRFLRRLRRMRGENMYTFPRASRKASRGISAATAPRKNSNLRRWQSQGYYSPLTPYPIRCKVQHGTERPGYNSQGLLPPHHKLLPPHPCPSPPP